MKTPVELPDITTLSPRMREIYQMRKQMGMRTKDVADKLGISPSRANQILKSAIYRLTRKPHWSDGLDVRAANVCNNLNLNSREKIHEAFMSGKLDPSNSARIRNYGWVTHKRIAKWLGLPEPMKKVYPPGICPHCGKSLRTPKI